MVVAVDRGSALQEGTTEGAPSHRRGGFAALARGPPLRYAFPVLGSGDRSDMGYVSAESRVPANDIRWASGTLACPTRWTRQRTPGRTAGSWPKSCGRDGSAGGRIARSETSLLGLGQCSRIASTR